MDTSISLIFRQEVSNGNTESRIEGAEWVDGSVKT
jgi:hypothetical protein